MIPMPLRTLMPLAGLVALVLGALLHILTGVTVPEGDVMAQAVVFHANSFIGVYAALTAVAFVGALLGNRLKMLSHPIFLASLAPLSMMWMLSYHIALSAIWKPTGVEQIALLLLGYFVPTGYLSWWLALAPHGRLKMLDVLLVAVPGVAYVAFLFLSMLGNIPTDMMKVAEWTLTTLVNNAIAGIVAVAGLSVAAVAFDSIVGGVVSRREHSAHADHGHEGHAHAH